MQIYPAFALSIRVAVTLKERKMTKPCKEVLVYRKDRKTTSMVKRCFKKWRAQQEPPIPLRCDNPDCTYHKSNLIWNDKKLELILDHIDGVNGNDRPENLRFLCPNCDSQNKETRGGGNRGRVEQSSGGYAITGKDGIKHHTLPLESSTVEISGGKATFSVITTPPKTK